jgi:hypothetical protein
MNNVLICSHVIFEHDKQCVIHDWKGIVLSMLGYCCTFSSSDENFVFFLNFFMCIVVFSPSM